MSTPLDIAEQQDRMLAELAELSMEIARNLQARALAAKDASEAADLSLAFHRVSRSIRQTLALRSKLERDRKRDDAEDRVQAVRARNARVERRKAQIKLGVERLVWSEADGDEAERLIDDLDARMEMDFLADVFAGDDPIEAHIARLCAEVGVDTPATFAARQVRTCRSACKSSRGDERRRRTPRRSARRLAQFRLRVPRCRLAYLVCKDAD